MADPVTVLSLCSGIGGLELGLRQAGLPTRVVAFAEREPFAAAVLLARMEDASLERAPVWCGDLADMPLDGLRGVDMVTAGFPCQPFSAAGKRRGLDDERWIWPAIARLVGVVGPRFVFLENVGALLAGGGFGPVLGDLASLGFDVEWVCVRASDVGAPHRRERVFILAPAEGGGRGEGCGLPARRRREGPGAPVADGPGSDVAHAVRSGGSEVPRGAHGDESPHEGRPSVDGHVSDGGSEAVADRDRDGRAGVGRQPGHDRDPRDDAHRPGSETVGDASRPRREGATGSGVQPNGQAPDQRRPALADSERSGRATGLAHADARRGQPDPLGCSFPPGPDDRDAWAEVLAADPTLEPSLRRVADGPPEGMDRNDRLRALGNAVVPAQAALAFRTLADRAGLVIGDAA